MLSGWGLPRYAALGCLVGAFLMVFDGGTMARPPEGPWITEGGPTIEVQRQQEEQQEPEQSSEPSLPAPSINGAVEPLECGEPARGDEYYTCEDLKAQRQMAAATDDMAWYSWAQTVVATVGALLLLGTMVYTARAAMTSATAAKAAQKSADVSEIALTELERPHLYIERVYLDQGLVKEVFDYEKEVRIPWVLYEIKNFGRSPAIIDEVCGQIEITNALPEHPIYNPVDVHKLDSEYILGVNEHWINQALCRTPINGEVMHALGLRTPFVKDPMEFFFFGYVAYESAIGGVETLGFCWRYNLNLGHFVRESRPNYAYRKREKSAGQNSAPSTPMWRRFLRIPARSARN